MTGVSSHSSKQGKCCRSVLEREREKHVSGLSLPFGSGSTMPHRGIALPLPALFFGNGFDCATALHALQLQTNNHFLLVEIPHPQLLLSLFLQLLLLALLSFAPIQSDSAVALWLRFGLPSTLRSSRPTIHPVAPISPRTCLMSVALAPGIIVSFRPPQFHFPRPYCRSCPPVASCPLPPSSLNDFEFVGGGRAGGERRCSEVWQLREWLVVVGRIISAKKPTFFL